jgi:hypothetical protein
MRNFYAPICPVYRQRKSLALADEYDRSVTSLDKEPYRKIWIAYPPAAYFMNRTRLLAVSAPVVHQRGYIRKPLFVLAVTYLPLLLIAFSLSAGVLLRGKWRKHLRWLAALVMLAYLYNAAACLEVAVIHELDDRRYVTVQMFLTLLAQFFALWFVLEFALEMRARAKSSCSNAGSAYRSAPDVRCG